MARRKWGRKWDMVCVRFPCYWIDFLRQYVELSDEYGSVSEIVREAVWEWMMAKKLNPCDFIDDPSERRECKEETRRALYS